MDSQNRRIGMMRPETITAIELLSKGKPGDTFTREQMAKELGCECGTHERGYGYVQTAIRHCESNSGVVWRWSKIDQCWRCLDSKGCMEVVKHGIRRAGRIARRHIVVSTVVNEDDLNDDDKVEHRMNQLRCGLLGMTSSGKFGNKLQIASHVTEVRLPDCTKLLEACKGPQNRDG